MRSMSSTFSGFTSMPRLEMRKPRSFPAGTPNTHFSGLSLSLVVRRLSKASDRSYRWVSCYRVFTMMSSAYASMLGLCKSFKVIRMVRWNVGPAFLSPKGMRT